MPEGSIEMNFMAYDFLLLSQQLLLYSFNQSKCNPIYLSAGKVTVYFKIVVLHIELPCKLNMPPRKIQRYKIPCRGRDRMV